MVMTDLNVQANILEDEMENNTNVLQMNFFPY